MPTALELTCDGWKSYLEGARRRLVVPDLTDAESNALEHRGRILRYGLLYRPAGRGKTLKSLLYYQGGRRAALLTHSLVEMVSEGGKKAEGITDLLDQARELDLHYIPSRYPNGIPSGILHQFYSEKVAEQALAAAEKIFSTVQDYFAGEKETLQNQEKKN